MSRLDPSLWIERPGVARLLRVLAADKGETRLVGGAVRDWLLRQQVADLDLATRLMAEAAKAQPRALAEPAPKVFLTQFADSAINLEVGFWIDDPEEGKGNIVSDVNFAIWRSFKEHGIAIPFPQRNLNIHVEGDANPQMLAALLSEEGDKAVVAHTGAAAPEKEAPKNDKATEPKEKPGTKA